MVAPPPPPRSHPPFARQRHAPPRPTWRERFQALRHVPELIRLVWETHRGYTVAMIALRAVRAVVPIATLWVGKLIIDTVVELRGPSESWPQLWLYVGIEIGIVIVGELLARASTIVESLLGDLFGNVVSVRLMRHAATLDLAQFEDPEFYDHLERARRQTVGRIGLLAQLLGMGQSAITLAGLGGILALDNPWLILLLTVAVLPGFIGETHFAALGYSLLYQWTPERRELDYLRYVGASDKTAKEVQMFGLAPWLIERYRNLSDRYYAANRSLSIRRGVASSALSLIGTIGYYGAYALILARTARGQVTIGTMTLLAGSVRSSRDLIQGLLLGASGIHEQALYLRDLFVFFERKPSIASKPGAIPVPNPIAFGFQFENVGFRYPGSERWAVRNVTFTLRVGERVALVGENGAGKTTLTKLLARLYDPTEGRITLDGVDVRDYDLDSLRQSIGVIFQDFVRYDMRFDENIGVGEIEKAREYLDTTAPPARPATTQSPPKGVLARATERYVTKAFDAARASGTGESNGAVPDSLRTAADQSLASSLLPRFPDGYRQMLGRRFEDGVDLSGGEWQKVALGRAYMRDAQVLILDEPTAALDARAEYEVFLRFSELMAGRTAVLISHRFSTVRMADRILVLEDGEVVEDGTHESLVARGGLYAELFGMQAEGYR